MFLCRNIAIKNVIIDCCELSRLTQVVSNFLGCGKGFVCIATSDPKFKNYFLTTQVDYLNYYYYPTTDHTFPLLLENASIEELPTKSEFKWKFKCMNCTSMMKCQILLLQKRYEFHKVDGYQN